MIRERSSLQKCREARRIRSSRGTCRLVKPSWCLPISLGHKRDATSLTSQRKHPGCRKGGSLVDLVHPLQSESSCLFEAGDQQRAG
jgi:hypothetical protein